ncbi:prepilin peptidase [Nitrosomonas sp. Nm33]|uniref:A24 family peptidase n=1 Tax=Nitrosomonas sp. Nm33 TaxID=133724 RepID=UPI0008971A0F|nr:prepilin peptidase [Nitrosomonas sp. Nm33]SDY03241.1 prepilin peptidase CpaA [Nitrosomonas sp. Nm33]
MHILNSTILVALLLFSAWHDIRQYRIPNLLVFSGAIIGVLLNSLLPQDMGGLGILTSLAGLGVGLVLLLPLYLLRALGAGDIKLMAMVGAFVGPVNMLITTVYILLAGGILAIVVVLLKGKLPKLIDNFKIMLLMCLAGSPGMSSLSEKTGLESAVKLPYGVAIAAGTFVYLATTL